jgi:AcrR family transcriptional regulator
VNDAEAATAAVPRRERTRQALTEAASALIAEKGVAGLRIQEITTRANVALGSFYNHFATKEALVEAVVASTIEVRATAIVEEMSPLDDPAEIVAFACQRVVRLAFDEPELAWLFVNLDRADQLFETIVHRSALAALEAGSTSGRFDISDPGAALIMIVGGALAIMRAVLDGRCHAGVDDLFAESVLRSLGLDRAAAVTAARPTHDR